MKDRQYPEHENISMFLFSSPSGYKFHKLSRRTFVNQTKKKKNILYFLVFFTIISRVGNFMLASFQIQQDRAGNKNCILRACTFRGCFFIFCFLHIIQTMSCDELVHDNASSLISEKGEAATRRSFY